MAAATQRGSTATSASPANPQARSVRTAAETAVVPSLPQSYIDYQAYRAGRGFGPSPYAPSGAYTHGAAGSAPTHQNAAIMVRVYEADPRASNDWGMAVYRDLKKYFSDIEKYNALVGSGPATKPRAAEAPVEERAPSFQAKRRGVPDTILTAGWGLDDKPRSLAKTLLGA